mmetsp:Transcript_6483/g.11608  ORF Transcript_6483/g.11608 Transcript_6483/m.11608 type:complete len:146 (-) Transcript_6483:293-730(-)
MPCCTTAKQTSCTKEIRADYSVCYDVQRVPVKHTYATSHHLRILKHTMPLLTCSPSLGHHGFLSLITPMDRIHLTFHLLFVCSVMMTHLQQQKGPTLFDDLSYLGLLAAYFPVSPHPAQPLAKGKSTSTIPCVRWQLHMLKVISG